MEALNEQADDLYKGENKDEDFDEPVKLIENFNLLESRIRYHDSEVVEIDVDPEFQKNDEFIDMDLEKMYQWLQICKDRHEDKLVQEKKEEKEKSIALIDDIDNLIQDSIETNKNKEKESYANILITSH